MDHHVGRGNYCEYMKAVCTENCKYAWVHPHGSFGWTCERPDTKEEAVADKIHSLELEIKQHKDAIKRASAKIKRLRRNN